MRRTAFALALSLFIISTGAVSQTRPTFSSAQLRAKGFDVMSIFPLPTYGGFTLVLRKQSEVYVCYLKEGEMTIKERGSNVEATYQILEGDECRLVK